MKTNNNFHILIVDDEKLNIELAAAYLKGEGYKLSFSLDAVGAMKAVMSTTVDLVLLDINMPQKNGFEVCKMLKEDAKTKDIPVIFLTAQTDMTYISKAFEVGGVDYINKPFNGVELLARVKTHLQTMFYMQEIKHKQSKLAQLSITDPLTKLHNTLYFDSQINSRLLQEKSFWVVYIKINNFSKINQIYGFHKANKIIRLFAKTIQEASFSNAIVARLYGVGFGILIKDYKKQNIQDFIHAVQLKILENSMLKTLHYSVIALHATQEMTLSVIYKKLQEHSEIAASSANSILFLE